MLDQGLHRFGPFLIIRTLGRGGMGEVFVARTPWDDNPVAAVKRLRPDVARVPTFAERFQHESELAVRLDHAHVVGTLDVGSVDGQLYVASELVLGKDTGIIADRLRERGQGGPAAVAIRLLLDTLAGLAYVHDVREPDGKPLRLVHRDVTPGNVLVGYDGIARLADFGLAKSLLTEKSNLTNHGEILGTPHYLAPEIIRGEPASAASDLYGMGAVMYRFLTGIAPHHGTTAEVLLKVLSEEVRPLSDLRPDLPPWLVSFIHRLLDKDPSRRPRDASGLAQQLTRDAKTASLLVPRDRVGKWLGTLFEAEYGEELEERERIIHIHPDDLDERAEGTVVLARPGAGSPLLAPAAAASEQLLAQGASPRAVDDERMEFADAQGTELELSEHEVRAAAADARPPVEPRPLDEGHGEVTEAAGRALGAEESFEGMPTRAVTVLPGSLFGHALPPNDARAGHQARPAVNRSRQVGRSDVSTHDDPADPEEATRFGNILGREEHVTELPGFVDGHHGRPRPDSFDPGITAPDPPESGLPIRQRPRHPDSVIVSPVASSPPVRGSKPASSEPRSVGPRAVADVPTDPPAVRTPRREERRRDSSPPRRDPAQAPPNLQKSSSTPEVRLQRTQGSTPAPQKVRNLMFLSGLLFVAVALGIGIGALVATVRAPPARALAVSPVRDRYDALRLRIDELEGQKIQIPERARQLANDARTALGEKRDQEAEAHILAAEKILGTP